MLNLYVVVCFIFYEPFRKQDLALVFMQSLTELLLNGLTPAFLQFLETYDIYYRYTERRAELGACGFHNW